MAFIKLAEPVDLGITTFDAWHDQDISGQTGYTSRVVGVELIIENTGSNNLTFGVRANGSTDALTNILPGFSNGTTVRARIGVDAAGIFEVYADSTEINVWLVAFYEEDVATFFVNDISVAQNTTSAFVDTNIAGHTGPDVGIAAFLQRSGTSGYVYTVRMNGGTDARTTYTAGAHNFLIAPLDGSEIFEQYIANAAVDLLMSGYLKAGATFHTNAIDRSATASFNTYQDITALPSGAIAGVYEAQSATIPQRIALRENGTTTDVYRSPYQRMWAVVPCDGSQIVEQKPVNGDVDLFELGYLTDPTPAGTRVEYTVAQDAHIGADNPGNDAGRLISTNARITSLADDPLEVGSIADGAENSSIFRFTGVAVPQGATIEYARLWLTADNTYDADASAIKAHVSAEASDNAPALDTGSTSGAGLSHSGNTTPYTNRPRSTADDGPLLLTSIVGGVSYPIPVTNVVQEIVDRAGWSSSNALAIILDTHTDTVVGEWQNWTKGTARLVIYYTASSGGEGVVSQTLGAIAASASGTLAIGGTATPTLGALTLEGTAELGIAATAAPMLGALTLGAAGALPIEGSLAATLGPLTLVATGAPSLAGQLSATLDPLSLVATGEVGIGGAAAATLNPIVSSASGTLPIEGAVSAALGDLALSATGALGLTGSVAATLEPITADAEGTGEQGGAVAGTLGDLTLIATAALAITGQTSAPLGALSLGAAGVLPIDGSLAATLGPVTLVATGELAITGHVSAIVGPLTLVAAGSQGAGGVVDATLEPLTLVATGGPSIAGQVSATLAPLTLTGTATIGINGTGTPTLGPVILVSTGLLTLEGQADAMLGALMLSAFGTQAAIGLLEISGPVLRVAGVQSDAMRVAQVDDEWLRPT